MVGSPVQSKKSKAGMLIFICWLVYAFCYLGKVNYSANITKIIEFYGVTKSQAGAVPTFFFFAYGVGQVVNGVLCKKYNPKWAIFASLTVSGIINLIIAVGHEFSIIKWLWMINGFALSVLWPTLIRLLSESLPQKALAKSSVIMGTTIATGTLIIYSLSSLYVSLGNFKLAFYTAAFAVFAVAIFWLFFYNTAVKNAVLEKASEETIGEKKDESKKTQSDTKNHKIFTATLCCLCFFSIGINLTKDGLTTWVPSILKEEFAITDSLSILLTLTLPILAIFGNFFAVLIHKKIPSYTRHSALFFAIIAAFVGVIIFSLKAKIAVLMLLGLIIVNFFASSLNSLVTGIFPLFMRERGNSGLFAGILNGFCYLGSTISAYGLGTVADNFGWISVFVTLIGFCGLALLAYLIYVLYVHKIKSK